ncbi:MAG TPA: TonB-dependent receptor, partial [Caulobacteraceae bacterium]
GAEEIQNITAGYMTDVGFKVPNVFMSQGSISPGISIRGVSSQSNINAGFPPAVGIYVDEVYQGRDPTFNTILNDVERIEVLRGPQGTLYGKNTIGGAINITTTEPSNDFTAFGDINIGNVDLFQVRATVGGAIIPDKLMVRASVVHRERGGWLENSLTGEDLNDISSNGGRLVIASQLTEQLRFRFSADAFKETGTSALETGPVVLAPLPAFANIPAQDPADNVVQLNAPEYAERDLYGFAGRFDYEMPGMDLTSITAYRQYKSDFHDDSDGLQVDAFDVGREENAENFSQELRLTSTNEGPLTWIAGAYFYVENIENNRRIHVGTTMPTLLGGGFAGFLWPNYLGESGRTESTIESSSYAFFGSATYQFAERWRLAAGLRWTSEEKDFAYRQYHPQLYTGGGPGGPIVPNFAVAIAPRAESYSDEQFTGDVSLSYEFNPDAVGYVKYSRGFKAGGFQTDVISPPFNPSDDFGFKAEFADNYEGGFKSYWFSRRVSLNAAVFYMEWKDKQEQIFTGLSFLIRNAANATSKGAELELTARPTRALTLDANLAYLDTRYEEFPGSPLAGQNFPGLPEWSGSVGAQYVTPITSGLELFARGDLIYRGETYTQPNASVTQVNEALTTYNARLGVQSDGGGWGVYLWGKNLGDEVVVGSGSAFPFPAANITTRSPGFGRTYGVELR